MTISESEHNRFARRLDIHPTNDVEQLKAQVERLLEQLMFNAAEYEREKTLLLHDLMQAKYDPAQRDLVDASTGEARPPMMKH